MLSIGQSRQRGGAPPKTQTKKGRGGEACLTGCLRARQVLELEERLRCAELLAEPGPKASRARHWTFVLLITTSRRAMSLLRLGLSKEPGQYECLMLGKGQGQQPGGTALRSFASRLVASICSQPYVGMDGRVHRLEKVREASATNATMA